MKILFIVLFFLSFQTESFEIVLGGKKEGRFLREKEERPLFDSPLEEECKLRAVSDDFKVAI